MKFIGIIPVAVAALFACGSISEPDRDVAAALQTDRLSYSFSENNRGFFSTPTIEVVVTNTSGARAFLTRGSRMLELVLEGLENGEWSTKYAKSIGDGGGGTLRLEPGESATFETTISGALPGTCQCSPIISFGDGIYRFSIAQGYVDSYDEELSEAGDELPVEFRVSNSFALDAP